jgi:hypothetical protein
MYDQAVREQALALLQTGVSLRAASLVTGISRATLRDWREHPDKPRERAVCPRCIAPPRPPEPQWDYAYLLGLYLGDGCISVGGDPAKGVWALRIFCADAWPGLRAECQAAMSAIRPANKVSLRPRDGCTEVISYSRHWPCLFPQHGPGKKHLRVIKLDPWQQDIVDRHPGALARGLFHSDGCRFLSRVRRPLASGDRWYVYPRYMFTNESADILGLCGQALDRLGVDWRFSRRTTISVARREAVARLDEFVGAKY